MPASSYAAASREGFSCTLLHLSCAAAVGLWQAAVFLSPLFESGLVCEATISKYAAKNFHIKHYKNFQV